MRKVKLISLMVLVFLFLLIQTPSAYSYTAATETNHSVVKESLETAKDAFLFLPRGVKNIVFGFFSADAKRQRNQTAASGASFLGFVKDTAYSIPEAVRGFVFRKEPQVETVDSQKSDSGLRNSQPITEEKIISKESGDLKAETEALKANISRLNNELVNIKESGLVIEGPIVEKKTLERTVEKVVSGISAEEVDAKLAELNARLLKQISLVSAGASRQTAAVSRVVTLTNRIDNLSGVTLNDVTFTGSVHGLSLDYLALTGGTLTGALSGTSAEFSGQLTVSGTATSTLAGDTNFDGGTLYIDSINNRVGVGTTSPSDTFAVAGPLYLSQGSAPSVTADRLYNVSGDIYWAGSLVGGSSVGNWTLSGGDVYRPSGNVGIASTSPYAALSVEGSSALGNSALAGYFTATTSTASVFPYASTTAVTVSGTASTTNLTVSGNSTLGTIISGLWQGTTVGETYGGTGQSSYVIGDILYADAADSLARLATSTAGSLLQLDLATGLPSYVATSSLGIAVSDTTGTLPVNRGGTGAVTFSSGGWLFGNDASALSASSSPTVGWLTATSTTATSTFPYLSVSTNSNLGTVIGGTWQGAAIGDAYLTKTGDWTGTIDGNDFSGGAVAAGDMLYGSGAGTIAELSMGASSTILTTNGSVPAWMATSSLGFVGPSDLDTEAELESLLSDVSNVVTNNDDLFLVNDADDVTTGQLTAANFAASSASATSTFAGGLAVETSGLVYDYSTNRVGIGTASPGSLLHLNSSGSSIMRINSPTNFDSGIILMENSIDRWQIMNDGDDADKLKIGTTNIGANTKVTIDSTGNIGIASTSPYAKLSVTNTGTAPSFIVEDSASPDPTPFIIDASGNISVGTTTTDSLFAIWGNAPVFSDQPSGSMVSIMDTSPPAANVGGTLILGGFVNWDSNPNTPQGFGGIKGGRTNSNQNNFAGYLSFYTSTGGATWLERMRINSSGQVGIGTTTPTHKLEVENGAFCVSTASGDCGSAGNTAGDIYYNAAHGSYTDIAEKYPSLLELEPGDVVAIDIEAIENASTTKPYVKRATESDRTLLGIVSAKPGLTLGDNYGKSKDYSIALIGRVPVKVSLENGEIRPGDRLTSSSIAGVAAKATSSGMTIGIALQSFNGTSEDSDYVAEGKIMAFVNLGYNRVDDKVTHYAPQITNNNSNTQNNFFIIDQQTGRIKANHGLDMFGNDIVNVSRIISLSGNWSIDENGRLTVEEVIAGKIKVTDTMEIGDKTRPRGITIYDFETRQPYCVVVRGGKLDNIPGPCTFEVPNPSNTAQAETMSEENENQVQTSNTETQPPADNGTAGQDTVDNATPSYDNSPPSENVGADSGNSKDKEDAFLQQQEYATTTAPVNTDSGNAENNISNDKDIDEEAGEDADNLNHETDTEGTSTGQAEEPEPTKEVDSEDILNNETEEQTQTPESNQAPAE